MRVIKNEKLLVEDLEEDMIIWAEKFQTWKLISKIQITLGAFILIFEDETYIHVPLNSKKKFDLM